MGFRINTNIAAMNAHRNSNQTNLALDKSLQSLSSGLRINTAADDASGLAIANQLKAQSTGLGQAISNANDGIGVMQTADGALDEYENIINTVRTKSIQAASDGQSSDSRAAIQRDISKLLDAADTIAQSTSFNGQQLLDGSFTNKSFHIGAYANETSKISIDSTRVAETGNMTEIQGTGITAAGTTDATFAVNGTVIGATVTTSATGSGGANLIADAINAAGTGVTASAETSLTGGAITAASESAITINGVALGSVDYSDNDSTGTLTSAINAVSSQTGVTATIEGGVLELFAADGENIHILGAVAATAGLTNGETYGAVKLSGTNVNVVGGTAASDGLAAGTISSYTLADVSVTSADDAERSISIADAALKELDQVRSKLGSTQNQFESTVRNISVTQVNVAAAESQIRDVDFAAESANFAKNNILAQAGSYAMSQANAVQQNVMRLLQ